MRSYKKKKTILFIHGDNPKDPLSSFFQQDLDILSGVYEVRILSMYPYGHGGLDLFLDFGVWKLLLRADAVFAWFGSCAAVVIMAKLLRRQSIVIAGGADVVWVPEIGYGLDPAQKINYSLHVKGYQCARRILLFSESSRVEFLKIPGIDSSKAATLYLGVDADHFRPSGRKKPYVFTVSYISESSIRRKGVLTLLETARLTPEIEYRIAGLISEQDAEKRILDNAPKNVTFLGYLDNGELLSELQKAKVYAQLSYHEGFGMAVAEAMACECIPVVTNRGAIPEVVGNTGYFVPVEDPVSAAVAIRAALGANNNMLENPRNRILSLFPLSLRAEGILREIRELICK